MSNQAVLRHSTRAMLDSLPKTPSSTSMCTMRASGTVRRAHHGCTRHEALLSLLMRLRWVRVAFELVHAS